MEHHWIVKHEPGLVLAFVTFHAYEVESKDGATLDIIRHKLVVHNEYCKVLGFSIGMEFQRNFFFDNTLAGLHWSFILVRTIIMQFA